MEAKDLVLLMLIPILLVSIIVYTNYNPAITGAATAKAEESNIIGQYSIMPSFRAKIDYDLNEYKFLKEKLLKIIDNCKKLQDTEKCIKDYISDKKNGIDWKCEENDEDILNDFVDKLNDCKNLKEENVVCRFSLDKRDYINKEINKRTFEIRLTNWHHQIKAELIEDKKFSKPVFIDVERMPYTDYDSKDNEGKPAGSIIIKVSYTDGSPVIEEAYVTSESERIQLSKTLLLYKTKDDVKFVEYPGSSFQAPLPANIVIDLPKTRGIKFCAKSDKQIYAYDASDNQVKLRNIVYKFAVTFPRPVPKPVENLEVHDALNTEHSAILVWDKSSEIGIKFYSIYHSQKDFIKDKIDDVNKNNEIKKISVPIENPIEIEDIDLNNCGFDPIGKPCKYSGYNKALEKGKLYYLKPKDKEKGKFIHLINDVEDGNEYNLAVTAVNDEDEEIDNDKSIEGNTNILMLGKNYQTSKSIDDLAPGKISSFKGQHVEKGKVRLEWQKHLNNLDGTKSDDIAGFNIYYKKQGFFTSKQDIIGQFANEFAPIAKANCEADFECEYSFNVVDYESGKTYDFAVIAIDKNLNKYTNLKELAEDFDVVSITIP